MRLYKYCRHWGCRFGNKLYQVVGTIKEISANALIVEKNGVQEAVNLDFVVRIREYPKNKKGKKKSVVLD